MGLCCLLRVVKQLNQNKRGSQKMARKAEAEGNGHDPKVLEDIIKRCEKIDDDIASIKASNAKKCQDLLAKKKDIFAEAKDENIPVKALKAKLKLRALEQQASDLIAGLEEDDRDSFEA